ncbi:MAG: flavodoxin family protein [Coriobacteriia bacterium]|nr:flavodoxin family protein [Coriobacteriia bacterium]
MLIVAIDASPVRGVVSQSVEEAARSAEAAGATVSRIRLADLSVHSCTGCGMCRYTEACKIPDDLPELAERISQADGVIFGLPSYFRRPDASTAALLARFKRFFPDTKQLVLPGVGHREIPPAPHVRAAKRAVIITACAAPEPLATFFGYTTGPIRELRSALDTGGIRTVGSLALTGGWNRHAFDEWERDRASSLGRMLAGKI